MNANLRLFCSVDPDLPNLAQPFSAGMWTFATNKHILVRVPRRPKVSERKNAPSDKCLQLFTWYFEGELRFRSFERIAFPKQWDTCPDCEGTALNEEGDGPCDYCGDFWSSAGIVPSTVRFGDTLFNGRYIELMQENLPGLAVSCSQYPHLAMCFRFEGGDGLLMPRKRPLGETVIDAIYSESRSDEPAVADSRWWERRVMCKGSSLH